jgi:hypothetical protein
MHVDDIIVFLGPSLPRADAIQILKADYRPPAARGDIYRVATKNARIIILIDGLFGETPAVFHKEILWALSNGIYVVGAASMGALRAAELDSFGMMGIGEIYNAYRGGRLERDDAVAVLHAPEELGYSPITVALVDIIATLNLAQRTGVVDARLRDELESIAGELFYKNREYRLLLSEATTRGYLSAANSLQDWMESNHVSQKAIDATAALKQVARHLDTMEQPFKPDFRFETTTMWRHLTREVDRHRLSISPADASIIINELVATGEYWPLAREALAYVLAERDIPIQEHDLNDEALSFAAELYQYENNPPSKDIFDSEPSGHSLGELERRQILTDEYRLNQIATPHRVAIECKLFELLHRRRVLQPILSQGRTRLWTLAKSRE